MDYTARQWVFTGGYEWYDSGDYATRVASAATTRRKKTKASQRRLRYKAAREAINKGSDFIYRDPFESSPALFFEFAELDCSDESILAFINKYGELWNDELGPSLTDYRESICDLRDAMVVWRMVREEDADRRRQYAKWEAAGRKGIFRYSVRTDALQGHRQTFVDELAPDPTILDALIASPLIGPMRMKPVRRDGALTLPLEVYDLLSVLWIQFATAVAENKTFRRCSHCNLPFELTPQVNRADRLFCSDSCRVKAYQLRKKQAISLRQGGETLREIAKKTSSDLATVKRWVANIDAKET